jgi:hypothetical protein
MEHLLLRLAESLLGKPTFYTIAAVFLCLVGALLLSVTLWALVRPKGWVAQRLVPGILEFLLTTKGQTTNKTPIPAAEARRLGCLLLVGLACLLVGTCGILWLLRHHK